MHGARLLMHWHRHASTPYVGKSIRQSQEKVKETCLKCTSLAIVPCLLHAAIQSV
jgi:hypothetical protein